MGEKWVINKKFYPVPCLGRGKGIQNEAPSPSPSRERQSLPGPPASLPAALAGLLLAVHPWSFVERFSRKVGFLGCLKVAALPEVVHLATLGD